MDISSTKRSLYENVHYYVSIIVQTRVECVECSKKLGIVYNTCPLKYVNRYRSEDIINIIRSFKIYNKIWNKTIFKSCRFRNGYDVIRVVGNLVTTTKCLNPVWSQGNWIPFGKKGIRFSNSVVLNTGWTVWIVCGTNDHFKEWTNDRSPVRNTVRNKWIINRTIILKVFITWNSWLRWCSKNFFWFWVSPTVPLFLFYPWFFLPRIRKPNSYGRNKKCL